MKKQFKLKKSVFIPILSILLVASVSFGVFLLNATAAEQPTAYDSIRASGIKNTSSVDFLYSAQCSMPYTTILNRNSDSTIPAGWQSGVFGVSNSSVQNDKRTAYIEAFVFDLLQKAYPCVQSNSFAEENARARQASMLEKICTMHNTDAATYAACGVSGMSDSEFNSLKNELINSGELTPTVAALLDDLRGTNTTVGELTRGLAAASEVDLLKTSYAAILRQLFPSNQTNDPDLANAVNRVASLTETYINKQTLLSMVYGVSTSVSKDVKPWADLIMSYVWQGISGDLSNSGATSSASLSPGKFGVNTFSDDSVFENYFELMKLADFTDVLKSGLAWNTLSGADFISAYYLLLGADRLTTELTLDFAENGTDSGLFVSVVTDNQLKLAQYKNRLRTIIAELDYFKAFSQRAFYNSFLTAYAPGATAYLNLALINSQYGSDEFAAATANIKKLVFSSGDVVISSSYTFDDDYDIFGDLTISAATYLNDKTVTVEGNVNHTSSTLYTDYGTLNIEKNYTIQEYGSIHMIAPEARLNVKKDFTTLSSYSHSGYLTNGVMTVGGSFTQRGTYGSFAASEDFLTILNGSGTQTIDFESTSSGLNIVRFDNTHIIFAGATKGFGLASNAVINNDLSIRLNSDLVLNGYDFTVNGDFELGGDGSVYLGGQTMTVNGDLTQSGSIMKLNGGTLNISGDYDILEGGRLNMINANDRLNVGDNFSTSSNTGHSGYLNNGIMTVKGDFAQICGNYSNFSTSENHKIIFNGSSEQRISFDSTSSGFSDVEFVNHNIVLDTAIRPLSLNHDVEINNDWDLMTGSFNLNGHTLKINGSLEFGSGTLTLNNGTLDIRDDFEIGESGGFHMTSAGDILNVGGNFTTSSNYSHSGYITNGVMSLGGDFTQQGNYASFAASYDFMIVLNGSGTQTIDFNSGDSGLNIVRFENSDVVFSGATKGFKLASNSVINNDISIQLSGDLKLNGYNLTVNGDFELGGSGTAYLDGQTMAVNGNLTQSGSTMKLYGGTLNISGDYDILGGGKLHMTDANDRLNVGGNFSTSSNTGHSGYLNNGIMTVKGDFTQICGTYNNFNTSTPHKVIFNGGSEQRISFDSTSSGFADVEFVNKNIVLDSPIRSLTLYHDAEIDNDWILRTSSLDLNGHTLKINGSLFFDNGTLTLNNGTLDIGDNLAIGENGSIHMTLAGDIINVGGDFSTYSSYSHSGYLNNGVMTVSGNMTQRGSNESFATSYDFTTVLNGNDTQTIDFASANSGLNIVSFDCSDIVFTGNIRGFMLADDAVINNDVSIQLGGELKLNGHSFTVNGDFELSGSGTVYLDGQAMTINGGMTQSGSTMKLNGGTLDITGDYDIFEGGRLQMVNDDDRLNVGGNFSTSSNTSHSGYLSKGIMTLKGNFIQTGIPQNFAATGSHKVVLDGLDRVQLVYFESTGSNFNTLTLVKDKLRGYRFSRPVCWNNLELVTAVYDFVVYSPLDTLATGSSVRITEKIDGINLSEYPVNYSISGNTSENTYITNDGVLFIGEDEEASSITIDATSADDENYTTSFDILIAGSDEVIMGDVDQNGVVTINDATSIQYYLADFGSLTENQISAADVDGDGEITIKDVTKIQKYLAGMINSLA